MIDQIFFKNNLMLGFKYLLGIHYLHNFYSRQLPEIVIVNVTNLYKI